MQFGYFKLQNVACVGRYYLMNLVKVNTILGLNGLKSSDNNIEI
jgi:hypothetical protein